MAQTETQQIVSGQVYNVSYSADGRYLSYTQDAGNVGTLYVVDLTDPGFKRAIDSGAADSLATQPIQSQLSADGSFVLYDNYAVNHSALFVQNLHTGTTSQITIDAAKYDDLVALGISADGRFIVYNAHLTGTGGIGSPNPSQDVTVVRDVTNGTETVVGPASPTDFSTDLTPDGHYLALTVANHVIVFDVRTGATLSDRTITGASEVRISDDGRYVAYSILSADKAVAQVYLHDMQNPNAPDSIVSTSAGGTTANDSSFLTDFSGDGRHVLFSSSSTNLGGASNEHYFLKDLDTGAVQPLTSGGLLSHDASTIVNTDGVSGLYVTTVQPPTITISSVSGDNRVNATEETAPITVSGTSDTDGATITVTSPSGATSTTTATGQHWSTTVSASGIADGQHNFTVTATDAFGHTSTATQTVLFDSVAPFISYSLNGTGSINATQLSASVISGKSDAVGQVVTFKIDNAVIGQATIQTPTPDSGNFGAYSLSFDASVFHDGVHILSVSVADAAGNVTSETLPFDVDTVPPGITISSVAEDDVVNGTEIGATSVSGTSEAIGRTVTITVGDQIIGTAEVQQDGTWIAGVSFEGSAGLTDVMASVSDPAGNVGTASQPVIVDGNVIRVSTDSQGHEGTGEFDDFHGFLLGDISANARFVLFFANGGPTNFTPDVVDHNSHAFLKDLETGSLTPLGQLEDPDLGAYFGSGAQELADDGRHLLFDLHGSYNVIDLSTGAVTRVDTNAQGQPDNGQEFADNGYVTGAPHISGDGRYVTFWSVGTNLVPGISDGNAHLYVKDLQTPEGQPSGDVRLVSFPGAEPASPFTLTSSTSVAAGRYVAFTSTLPAAPSDTNGVQDVFLRDLQTGAVTLISANLSGQAGDSYSYDPVISADGRFVAFTSHASDLIAGQSGPGQVYLRDVQAGTTQLVSSFGGNPITGHADSISSDGRYVGWASPGTFDVNVWVYDTQTGSSTLASRARAGVDTYVADTAELTPDGRYIAFTGYANNNVPGDTNQATDVFLRRLDISGTMTLDPIAGNDAISSSERSAALAVSGSTTLHDGTISVRIDGVEYGTATVGANGHWATTIDVTGLAEGHHAFAATVLDDLGFATSDGAIVDVAPIQPGGSTITVALTVQTASGIDLRWATLYNEMANSPIGAGGTTTQYICIDSGQFNGQSAPIKFVITGTGFTYSGSFPNIQLTGGTITGVQETDSSNNVLATYTGFSISATAFNAAMATYVAGGANPNPTALNAIFLALAYHATGGAGADRLQGGNLNDTIIGSTGNDTIDGGAGTNTIDYSSLTTPGMVAIIPGGGGTVNKGGANGSDTLTGGQILVDNGTNRTNGDVFYVDAAETITANGANFNYLIELTPGVNLAYGANFTGITEFVSNVGNNTVNFASDTHFAYLYGSTGNDTLTLGTGGGYLIGGAGTNTLNGGANATNLFVSGGTDTMNGGSGTASNFYYVDGDDQVNGAGAFNTVIGLVPGVTFQVGSAQYQNVQEFVSNSGTNTITVANTDSDFVYLYGGAGNDTLTTGSGGGYLIGEGGTNVLNGGGGLNVFVAGGGSAVDTMNGGSGSNVYFIDANSIVHGAGTFNTVVELGQSASLVLGSVQLGSTVQQVVFNGGINSADFHTATSSVFLYGGANNDTLFGGTGNDFLYGGLGTNTFKFAAGWGQDTIEDWTAGTNSQIDLTGLAGLGVHATSDLTQTITAGNDVITSSHTGTNSITLMGVGSALTAGSFHFA